MVTITVAVPPGDILKEELEARGWSPGEFANMLGMSPRLVREIIAAKRSISPATARAIGAAFGTSAQVWLNLDDVSSREVGRVALTGQIHTDAVPRDEPRDRGIVDAADSGSESYHD